MTQKEHEAALAAFAPERKFRDASAHDLVEEIGRYDAQIARLAAEREERADELKARGPAIYVGTFYQCNVYERDAHLKLSTEYVKKVLEKYIRPKHPKVFKACFQVIEHTLALRCDARKVVR